MQPQEKKVFPSHKSVDLVGVVVVDDNGELKGKLNSPQLYQHFLKTYCKVGDYLSIKVTNKRPKRSVAQNNFFHLYLSLVSLSSGHTVRELKEWVKKKFLSQGVKEMYGEKVRIVKSTADLNISEFAELMMSIADKTGVPLPDTEPFNQPLTEEEYQSKKVEQKVKYKTYKPKIK